MRLRNRNVRSETLTIHEPADERERLVRSRLKRSIQSAARSLVLDVDDAFALALIGVESWGELVTRLAEKFTNGLNWDDPNAFHIDHQLPISSFDTNSLFQLHACFFHENLQPIDWRENLKKGPRVCFHMRGVYLRRLGTQWARKFKINHEKL